MTRVADYLLWGSGTAGRRSPGVRLGSLAGVHESPLIGETAVIGRGGTTSRDRGGGGGGGVVMDDNDGHKNATR